MRKLTIRQMKEGTKGTLIRGSETEFVSEVSIDSRKADRKSGFFAIVGDVHDAHKFLPQVVEAGCKTLIVSDEKAVENLNYAENINIILVENTVKALQDLSAYYLNSLDIKKIAITGSTGKTSTRDLTYAACSIKYKCGKNEGNLNNHIGVPLTILSFDEDVEVGVFEMGMDRLGEIDRLADIVRPQIGIITNIGMSHIENLGSQQGIFQAKMELTNYFTEDNTLVISQDEEFLTKQRTSGKYRLVATGMNGKSDYIISDIDDFGAEGIQFTLEYHQKTQRFRLPVPGRHNALNGALAVAAAGQLGISMEQAAQGLSKVVLTDKRLSVKGHNGIKVIDDTYNASPDSMKSALDVLMHTPGLRKIAILGDMFELGAVSKSQHELVGIYAAEQGVQQIIAIGDHAQYLADGAKSLNHKAVFYYKNKESFLKEMSSMIEKGDVILVKGSRGMEMEKIVKKLMEY